MITQSKTDTSDSKFLYFIACIPAIMLVSFPIGMIISAGGMVEKPLPGLIAFLLVGCVFWWLINYKIGAHRIDAFFERIGSCINDKLLPYDEENIESKLSKLRKSLILIIAVSMTLSQIALYFSPRIDLLRTVGRFTASKDYSSFYVAPNADTTIDLTILVKPKSDEEMRYKNIRPVDGWGEKYIVFEYKNLSINTFGSSTSTEAFKEKMNKDWRTAIDGGSINAAKIAIEDNAEKYLKASVFSLFSTFISGYLTTLLLPVMVVLTSFVTILIKRRPVDALIGAGFSIGVSIVPLICLWLAW